jgi:hypothetical protein
MSKLLEEKNRIKIPHKHKRVFPNNLVLVKSQELGRRIQIREVKKMRRNLIFSIRIQVFLIILDDKTLEDRRITRIIGKLKKFKLILGK